MTVSLSAKGETWARVAMAIAIGAKKGIPISEIAAERWGVFSPAAKICKGLVASGGLIEGADWGQELATFRGAAAEFFELVKQRTIVGRLSSLRRVPFRTRLISPSTGSSAYWVGKAKPKPVSALAFDQGALEPMLVAALVVITEELMTNSDPRSETWLRQDMVRAMSEAIDAAFLDASGPGDAVTPASILDGIAPIAGSGTMATDMNALLEKFEGNLEFAILALSPYAATQVTSATDPNIGARGGEWRGIPAVTSSNVPSGLVALIDSSGIAIGEGDAELKASTQGSIDMADPASVVDGATSHVSLFQANAVALLAEQTVNWRRMRDEAVKYVEGATWAMQSSDT